MRTYTSFGPPEPVHEAVLRAGMEAVSGEDAVSGYEMNATSAGTPLQWRAGHAHGDGRSTARLVLGPAR